MPFQKRLKHVLHRPTLVGDQSNARGAEQGLERPGNRTANKHVWMRFCDPPGPGEKVRCLYRYIPATKLSAVLGFHQQQVPSHIQNGRNPARPFGDRYSHRNPQVRNPCQIGSNGTDRSKTGIYKCLYFSGI